MHKVCNCLECVSYEEEDTCIRCVTAWSVTACVKRVYPLASKARC
jgi:hypothetical protein